MTLHDLPRINASLNATSAILLVLGYVLIKLRKVRLHAWTMAAAVLVSMAFLTCYLTYHLQVPEKSSGLPHGSFRTAYLIMLASHVLLAAAIVPLIIWTLLLAWRRRWHKHKKIAWITLPLWLYVSVTGVIIYWILYHVAPTMTQR
ncbi:MAG TPA: DUF420 domain-containing protein [Tepidisphaeraceae bacterium]